MNSKWFILVGILVVSLVLLGCTSTPQEPTTNANDSSQDPVLNQSAQELNSMTNEGDLTVPSELDDSDLTGVEDSISESDLG